MKVIIMTDLEGISGVDRIEMIDEQTPGYQQARTLLMADVNAAVAGAADAGASEILVIDGHGSGKNMIDGQLDPRAVLCESIAAPGLLDGACAYLEVGCHARAGTLNAFLDHTQSSRSWFNYWINGELAGEIAQGAAFCGSRGVPFVMVSGDEAACVEARALLGDRIVCACVKRGLGRNRAECIEPAQAQALIRKAAEQGVRRAAEIPPYQIKLPADIRVELYRSDYCDELAAQHPEAARIGARCLAKTVTSIETYRDLLF